MSSTGIMLPDCDDGTDEMMRDIEYMKEMYPEELRKVSMAVEEECDKLEYEGSPMLVQYPDREEMRRVARRVYDDLSESGQISEDCYAGMASAGVRGTAICSRGTRMRQLCYEKYNRTACVQ